MGPSSLDRYRRDASGFDEIPTPEQVLAYLRNPSDHPGIQAYIDQHPDYRELLERVPRAVEHHIKVAAYYCFLNRQQKGANGSDKSDWFEAESSFCNRFAGAAQAAACDSTK